ncbi:hypothetical protein CSW53_26980 (plasmid) [Rhodococcus ruber]|nr:hypothetical protein CSW53_26980 [Rhodococcus ruber]
MCLSRPSKQGGSKGCVASLAPAYELKEALRAVFAGDLDDEEMIVMLGRWCSWAQRCRIPQFVNLGRTVKVHLDGILAVKSREVVYDVVV